MSTGESSQTVAPRFEKKKRCVSRDNLLEQAEKLMDDLAANKALLEIHYKDEVQAPPPTLLSASHISTTLCRWALASALPSSSMLLFLASSSVPT